MDDLISRQAAIYALQKEINKGTPPFNDVIGSIRCGVRLARNIIEDLPPAQRTGRWKVSDLPKGKMKYCSECGFGQYIADERRYGFCPNCGADMRGEQDE